jgi:hypothetical protein
MAILVSENFDGVTAPAWPTGWTMADSPTNAAVLTETSTKRSGVNGLGIGAGTPTQAWYNTQDGASGEVTLDLWAIWRGNLPLLTRTQIDQCGNA